MYKIQSLAGIWQWQKADDPAEYKGTVPGTLLSDMLDCGLIEDPYWRCNEYPVRELMGQDYQYHRSFMVTAEDLQCDCAELVCDGLDTIASVYLNDVLIAQTDDMHRIYRIPAGTYLHSGENHIRIRFASPLQFVRAEDAGNDIFYASTGCMRGNAALRKAHYMFGWDWGPQLPDMGIFRDIRIEYSDIARIEDVDIRQDHAPDGRVQLSVDTKVRWLDKGNVPVFLELEICDPMQNLIASEVCSGDGKFGGTWIKAPQLWWPNGLGGQPLYEVRVYLADENGTRYDSRIFKIGLRTVTVSTDPNEFGHEFAITVNGVKIFAMGANIIPEDNILTRVSQDRTKRLIEDCAAANFNCLRVWGGGYYPEDYFYDKCDEEGILIWQDLMFGCNVYALTEGFEDNIVAETTDQVRRLKNHACLALWCGNNEMEWGWGEGWKRLEGHHPRYKADYTKIFEYVLPRAIRAVDDTTFYWPSSPSSGGAFDDPNAVNRGDQHYWEVWHSGRPFTDYGDFSFCSEYGFQSFPHSKTIASFTLPEDRNIFSRVMESHQKNGTANGKILGYVADYYLYPKDMDSLAYISQILQLKAIEYGVGHWRRNRGRCMGSLYWQLNDCWPVASWASIDYYGRWKALHYGARRFYSPLTISICEKEELSAEIAYYLHNDTRASRAVRVEALLLDREFQTLWSESQDCVAEPLAVAQCMTMDFTDRLDDRLRGERYSVFRLYQGGELLQERTVLFVKPKHFSYLTPDYDVAVTEQADCFAVCVKASSFCQYVELYLADYDGVFSDNFFDIVSADGVTVWINKCELPADITPERLSENLVVRSVADSYGFDNVLERSHR